MTNEHNNAEGHHQDKKAVEITVNSQEKEIEKGSYLVSSLKEQWGIPAEHELNLIKHGKFHALENGETIKVHKGDEFCSQVKSGGAS